jgi:hypothetical protein
LRTAAGTPELQYAAGNQVMQEILRGGWIRAKLTIGAMDDPAEREAEQIAPRVGTSEVADEVPARKTEVHAIHRTPSHRKTLINAPGIVERLLESGGRPLDQESRAFFEPRFVGQDLSHVRIHTRTEAAASARSIDALTYTAGSDIVFGSGQFSPESSTGRRLLAHELAHVAQQGQTQAEPRIHRKLFISGDDKNTNLAVQILETSSGLN